MVACNGCCSLFFLICLIWAVSALGQSPIGERDQHKVVFLENTISGIQKYIQDGSEVVDMYNREGKLYSCVIPPPRREEEAQEEIGQEALATIVANILDSRDSCILHGTGWWTYEFCFGDKIRQFHMEGTTTTEIKISAEYLLGKYPQQEDDDYLKLGMINHFTSPVHGAIPYVSQQFDSGTFCELTNQPRNAEIRYYCQDPDRDFLSDIKEPSSCTYTVHINLQDLCKIKEFGYSKGNDLTQVIYCQLSETKANN